MEYNSLFYDDVKIEISRFYEKGEIIECHAMFHVQSIGESYIKQLNKLHSAFDKFLELESATTLTPVFKRYFLSDIYNQIDFLKNKLNSYPKSAVSIIEQPPLDGSKIALWVWLKSDIEILEMPDESISFGVKDDYYHYFTAEVVECEGNSEEQTYKILDKYEEDLQQLKCSIEHNCIRTGFFVSDIDTNYHGVVIGRKRKFNEINLTEKTHYIASTGISGRHKNPKSSVLFDAYAIDGIKTEQITYLYARDYLNPTYEYGVTFERGVNIDFGSRNQVFISGTASIDNKGRVMYEGDIVKQTERMLINVSKLLEEADTGFENVSQLIVYLRDISDYNVVNSIIENQFPDIPKVIVHAAVCRPTWLVEIECIAMK
ncbi:MAG: Rid family hydrolase [Fermentimonas sp.]|nr:Rid family hydrolase [Fermentimonas sp.]